MDSTKKLTNTNSVNSSSAPKRIRLENEDWTENGSRSRLLERWKEQELYIDHLESRLNQLQQSTDSNERLREKDVECKKLKSMLNYRLLTKTTQQQTLDQMRVMMQTPSLNRLRQTFLDPSINLIFGQMRDEIERTRKAREETQNELDACQFTPDSKTGKMLMARCKKLLEENEQLGKLVSSDNVAKLESEIALQNTLLSNLKDAQKTYDDILIDMDTNMDAMSGVLLHLQQELVESNRKISSLNEENSRLKNLCQSLANSSSASNGTVHLEPSTNPS